MKDIRVVSDMKAIYSILQHKGKYVCYMGAGASAEAAVPTAYQICNEIRDELIRFEIQITGSKEEAENRVDARLKWQDKSRRYSMCMLTGYETRDSRVSFFREKLKGKRPSFCHHAVALLMTEGYFKHTCLTTNFDKLLESAFLYQGSYECQPIRSDDEVEYWEPESGRHYVFKLHGDYDTDNVRNTDDETIEISERMKQKARDIMKSAGVLVLGSAGYEKSVRRMFDEITNEKAVNEKILSSGLLWGVYMGQSKPKVMPDDELEDMVKKRLDKGEAGDGIIEMMQRMSSKRELFAFFPVWGAGAFMLDLIQATRNRALIGTAELYLDPKMRLRRVFTRAGLPEKAIAKHIAALDAQAERLASSPHISSGPLTPIFEAEIEKVKIRGLYGDITSRTEMSKEEFQGVRRAVVSPEDTFISAGGGVAYSLLDKAGLYNLLYEVSKFSPIEQGTVAVTSGGHLPVHYIFHAASIIIGQDGDANVTEVDVRRTTLDVLNKAAALQVGALWIPLMGSGVGTLSARQSFEGILDAIIGWENKSHSITIMIVIFNEQALLPHFITESVKGRISPPNKLDIKYSALQTTPA